MKILFLPNWHINFLLEDIEDFQAPDKYAKGKPYWFFKYMPDVEVDIIDYQQGWLFHKFEKKYLKNYFYQCWKAFRKRAKYDVIISHGAQSGLFYSLLTSIFKSKCNPLHIIIDVGGMNGSRINRYETPLIRKSLKSKPAIIYHSKSQVELYQKAYPELIPASKFIRFGVDAKYFMPLNLSVENYVLAFGYSKRDYPTLIVAWEKIQTDTKLKIVGIKGISSERIIYEQKMNIHQLKETIAKSLFVVIPLPLFKYSYGQMSFLQSMALGKPVIVTKTPSSDEYLIDGQGTFYVKPYDVDDMIKKIKYLLQNKNQLAAWGLLARKQIEERLDEKIMANEMYSFILQLLKSQK